MKKVTQKQMAFYVLYKSFKNPETTGDYIPTWKFVGEMRIPEKYTWVMMSYKCPTRLTDLYQENPELLERKQITGKSGSKYYTYRFSPYATPSKILDPKILKFYKEIK